LTQDEFDPLGELAERELPQMVRIQVEFIEIPQEKMTELLSGPQKSGNDTELRAKLQGLLKAGEAAMLETQMVTARSGQKASSESIHEYIYPTEYEPPAPPRKDGEEDRPAVFPMNPAIPTAFETRNVGSTLEVEPTIDTTGKMIDLRFLPELVYHTGNETWTEVTEGENTYRIQMPNFYTIRFNTSVTLISGQPSMVAAASPKNDQGDADFSKKILVFVRADVLTVGR
jgi:Flp pilus assembly secretin CpaC